MSDDLQSRFTEALRAALAGDGKPGASVMTVRGPDVHINPTIKADLSALPQPLLVEDVARQEGAYAYKMTVARNASGLIVDVLVTPEKFVPLGAFIDD